MSAELRQVADGCAYKVRSFTSSDINGYRFHTTRHEQSRPNRRTTNTGVFTSGFDGVEYYRIIEEIYELTFHGCKPLNPVIFKCHWFDPSVVRWTPNLGQVEIRQSFVLPGDDVYIVAQQATSRVGPIEAPQIPEFLRQALMGSSTTEELKKYTNSCFMVANLLIPLYSNAIGLILK